MATLLLRRSGRTTACHRRPLPVHQSLRALTKNLPALCGLRYLRAARDLTSLDARAGALTTAGCPALHVLGVLRALLVPAAVPHAEFASSPPPPPKDLWPPKTTTTTRWGSSSTSVPLPHCAPSHLKPQPTRITAAPARQPQHRAPTAFLRRQCPSRCSIAQPRVASSLFGIFRAPLKGTMIDLCDLASLATLLTF